MFEAADIRHLPKPELYEELARQLDGLLHGERDLIANLANASALVFQSLADLNWAGFYLMKDGELVLGPFQGRTACIRIAVGKGVCGAAVAEARTQLVPDVHAFPGHIACDAASRSELVVPLIVGGEVKGVLDLDSPSPARFDEIDACGCERFVEVLLRHLDF
jgi:GAF domain-containing protein